MTTAFEGSQFKDLRQYVARLCTCDQILKNLDTFSMIVVEAALAETGLDESELSKVETKFELLKGWFDHYNYRGQSIEGLRLYVSITIDGQIFSSYCYMALGGGGRIINFYLQDEVRNWVEA